MSGLTTADGFNPVTETYVRDPDDDDVRRAGPDGNLAVDDANAANADGGEEDFVDPAALSALRAAGIDPGAQPAVRRHGGNTGPKGVLNDAAAAARSVAQQNRLQEAAIEAHLRRACVTTLTAKEEEALRRVEEQAASANSPSDSSADDSELDELERELLGLDTEAGTAAAVEDTFLKQYRAQRLSELAAAQVPSFGWLFTVTPEQFVQSVDEEPATVTVIVHLYESYLRPCKELNRCFRALARRFPHVKFMALRASSTRDQSETPWDEATLPIILVYRGGTVMQTFVNLSDPSLLGPAFDEDSLEVFLRRHELL